MEKRRYLMSTGNILIVTPDDNADSPNDWDNDECFLVYDHRDFCIKRKGFDPEDINNNDLTNSYDNYYIFPVYAYIHSGVRLSLSRGNDRFDTSMKGFILVKKDQLISWTLEEKPHVCTKEDSLKMAQNLIETWNQYLSGDVYRYETIEEITCKDCGHITTNTIDCYGGFYGDDIATNGILDNIEGTIVKEL